MGRERMGEAEAEGEGERKHGGGMLEGKKKNTLLQEESGIIISDVYTLPI